MAVCGIRIGRLLPVVALLVPGTFLASTGDAVALSLKGTDILADVVNDVLSSACYTGPVLSYAGGRSDLGEAAMVAGTQLIAPMSRELSSTTIPAVCNASPGQELLIGLEGIVVVGANQPHANSLTGHCTDAIVGDHTLPVPSITVDAIVKTCDAAEGCASPGVYVFQDWRDVLALLYGGQNHTSSDRTVSVLNLVFDPLRPHLVRNPARVDCSSAARVALALSWGTIFSDQGPPSPGNVVCRTVACIKLKHAFRLGDRSDTTSTFASLLGLIDVPPFTTCSNMNGPCIDAAATANPFCNAGERPMNMGDSDYLDLDPIRRIADSGPVPRAGLEQVAEGFRAPSNPGDPVEPPVTVLFDFSAPTESNILPDPNIAGSAALQGAALLRRSSLGLVLPIEVPPNYANARVAYFAPIPGAPPLLCALAKFAPTITDPSHASTALCPNGRRQPCLLPVNVDGGSVSFNCLTNTAVPVAPPLRDARAYNLLVVDQFGHYVRDDYINPNLTLPALKQHRVVSAFYRLHTSQSIVSPFFFCQKSTSISQIGCLVAASPCSIGFAEREAVDFFGFAAAFQIGQNGSTDRTLALPPSPTSIGNAVRPPLPAYPMARPLWVNAYGGLSGVPLSSTGEGELLDCMGRNPANFVTFDIVMGNHNFVPVPAGVARTYTCPSGF